MLMPVWKLRATHYVASFALRPPISISCAVGCIHCRSRRFQSERFSALTGNRTSVVFTRVYNRTKGLLKLKGRIKLLTAIQISVRLHKHVTVGRELAMLIAYIFWEGNV